MGPVGIYGFYGSGPYDLRKNSKRIKGFYDYLIKLNRLLLSQFYGGFKGFYDYLIKLNNQIIK